MNLRIGRLSRILFPGWGSCYRCGTNWRFVRYHVTNYVETGHGVVGRGCFSLCEKCWADLAPADRLGYYRQLWLSWPHEREDDWPAIRAAVLAGK